MEGDSIWLITKLASMKLLFISQLINQNKSSDLNLDSYKSLFLFWDIIFLRIYNHSNMEYNLHSWGNLYPETTIHRSVNLHFLVYSFVSPIFLILIYMESIISYPWIRMIISGRINHWIIAQSPKHWCYFLHVFHYMSGIKSYPLAQSLKIHRFHYLIRWPL